MRLSLALIGLILALLPARAETLQEGRWRRATVPIHRVKPLDSLIDRIMANRARYQTVDRQSNVPWYVIGGLHNMEASGSFHKHLHEGSPLSGRTRWVPKGRPVKGKPPFTWEESAVDALAYDRMGDVRWSSLDATLAACERYNGTGYLRFHPDVPTPYLWSGTSLYVRGKYVADGKWSSTAISEQIGIAAIWKRMEARGILDFTRLQQ